MKLTFSGLISPGILAHTKSSTSNGEKLKYYIDKSYGWKHIPIYEVSKNNSLKYSKTLSNLNIGHNNLYENFIDNIFIKLDKIIDLDFIKQTHKIGSNIDIYKITYSSGFDSKTVGQARRQTNYEGKWWEIYWKEYKNINPENININLNTIIHEIGHTLGLRHPYDEPYNKLWNSDDTVMSYNRGENGWRQWFSEVDLNALISNWGRENDNGEINYLNNKNYYKFKKASENKYEIKTDLGYENITGIEKLNFIDQSISVKEDIIDVFELLKGVDDITGQIYRLYNSALGRFPDKTGIYYWINKNISGESSLNNIATSFIQSEEFETLYGNESTNKEFINTLYDNVLDRLPDSKGLNYWLNQLEKGYENRTELVLGFSESLENKSIFSAETMIF